MEMSFKNLNCFATQCLLAFLCLYLLSFVSSWFACYVSFVGKLIVLSSISWCLAKWIRKRLNNEPITSFKRAVLVTGCDSGFGNALAFKLNENGYRVYATVLDPKSDGAQKLLTGSRFDGKTHVFKMDVTNDEEVKSVYEQVRDDLKRNGEELWAVVNNAGIIVYGPFDWGTIETYKQVFEVNTFGMVRVTRTFLPLLRQSKGRVVNLVSIGGRVTAHHYSIYCMSKHASISFSDAIRRELKKYGIKVTTFEPMPYKTQMTDPMFYARAVQSLWEQTSEDVKQVYGREFYEKMLDINILTNSRSDVIGNDIYEVVDLLVEAVRSPDPQIRYMAMAGGCVRKWLLEMALKMPTEVIDQIISLLFRHLPKPVYLTNEE